MGVVGTLHNLLLLLHPLHRRPIALAALSFFDFLEEGLLGLGAGGIVGLGLLFEDG